MLPAQSSRVPSGSRRSASSAGQVGVLDHLGPAADLDDDADPLVGVDLLDDLERDLGVGLAVQAEERGVGDLDERVIDLEIEDRADSGRSHLLQARRRAVGPGRGQGGEGAAVAVGAEGEVALVGEQDLARRLVDGRHLPLGEEADALQAEIGVLGEEPGGRLVVLGAGHDVERDRPAVAAAEGEDLLAVDLEEGRARDRADRVGPLRAVEPQPGPLAARDDDDGDLAGREHRLAHLGHVPARDALGVGPGQAAHGDGPDLGRRPGRSPRRPGPGGGSGRRADRGRATGSRGRAVRVRVRSGRATSGADAPGRDAPGGRPGGGRRTLRMGLLYGDRGPGSVSSACSRR